MRTAQRVIANIAVMAAKAFTLRPRMGASRVKSSAIQRFPHNVMFCASTDGLLAFTTTYQFEADEHVTQPLFKHGVRLKISFVEDLQQVQRARGMAQE